jgi:hypothetical protein
MAKLQRSMKEEEQRKEKNLPKFVRRRWNGGERAVGDPISPAMSGRGAGPAASTAKSLSVGEDKRRREGRRRRRRFSIRLLRRRRARGRRAEEEEGVGVKR